MSREMDLSGYVLERTVHRWEDLPDGRLALRRRKLGRIGTALLRLVRVSPYVSVRLDALGSEVWRLLDGHRSAAEVLRELEAHHPDEEHLADRLGRYLSMLALNRLVRVRK